MFDREAFLKHARSVIRVGRFCGQLAIPFSDLADVHQIGLSSLGYWVTTATRKRFEQRMDWQNLEYKLCEGTENFVFFGPRPGWRQEPRRGPGGRHHNCRILFASGYRKLSAWLLHPDAHAMQAAILEEFYQDTAPFVPQVDPEVQRTGKVGRPKLICRENATFPTAAATQDSAIPQAQPVQPTPPPPQPSQPVQEPPQMLKSHESVLAAFPPIEYRGQRVVTTHLFDRFFGKAAGHTLKTVRKFSVDWTDEDGKTWSAELEEGRDYLVAPYSEWSQVPGIRDHLENKGGAGDEGESTQVHAGKENSDTTKTTDQNYSQQANNGSYRGDLTFLTEFGCWAVPRFFHDRRSIALSRFLVDHYFRTRAGGNGASANPPALATTSTIVAPPPPPPLAASSIPADRGRLLSLAERSLAVSERLAEAGGDVESLRIFAASFRELVGIAANGSGK